MRGVIYRIFRTFFFFLFGSIPSWASNDESPFDVSAKVGGSLGTLSIESTKGSASSKETKESYALGGIPFYLQANFDMSERFSFAIGPGLLFDAANSVILRQTIEFGALMHVFGGARRLNRPGEAVSIVATSPWNLSLGLKTSLNNYGARVETVEFTGSVIEAKIGLEYRRDVSQNSAYGSEIYATTLTIPSSVTRIQYQAVELLGFWRFYL